MIIINETPHTQQNDEQDKLLCLLKKHADAAVNTRALSRRIYY